MKFKRGAGVSDISLNLLCLLTKRGGVGVVYLAIYYVYHVETSYSEGYLNYFNDKIYTSKFQNAIAQKLQNIFT